MNHVSIIGRLTADPEIRQTQTGLSVANYRLAVDGMPNRDGEKQTDFIPCVAWGKSAEFAQNYLRKGMKIAVEGRLHSSQYTDKDGNKRSRLDVTVERHEFCESKNSGQSQSAQIPGYSAPPPTPHQQPEQMEFTEYDDSNLPF